MDDDMYWELLEEQHAHDVVMIGAEGSEKDENGCMDHRDLRSDKSGAELCAVGNGAP